MTVCDKDCFNCRFDDCILDEMSADDYKEARAIEKELLYPKTYQERKIAAKQKAYYEAKKKEKENAVLQM